MNSNCIPIHAIDTTDTRFRFSYPSTIPHQLYTSIKNVGIINPVILRRLNSKDNVQCISGFRRIAAAKKLKFTNIPAVLYDMQDLSDRDALLIAVHDNYTTRGFNIIETALIVRALSFKSIFSDKEIISDILPLFSLDPNRYIFDRIIKLLSLPASGQNLLAEGRIALHTAETILQFPSPERTIILNILHRLSMGKNKSDDIVNLIYDISKRDNISVKSLMRESGLREILNQKSTSGPDKFHAIKKYLYDRRYPTLSRMEGEIRSLTALLNLPGNIKLTPPHHLEGEGIMVAFPVINKKDMRESIRILNKLLINPHFRELLKKT